MQVRAIRGWSWPTFKRRLQIFKRWHPELAGGGWYGNPYSLPTQSRGAMAMVERMAQGRLVSANVRMKLFAPDEPGSGSTGLREQALRHLKEQTNGSDRRT
jgi:hypothetical protein